MASGCFPDCQHLVIASKTCTCPIIPMPHRQLFSATSNGAVDTLTCSALFVHFFHTDSFKSLPTFSLPLLRIPNIWDLPLLVLLLQLIKLRIPSLRVVVLVRRDLRPLPECSIRRLRIQMLHFETPIVVSAYFLELCPFVRIVSLCPVDDLVQSFLELTCIVDGRDPASR